MYGIIFELFTGLKNIQCVKAFEYLKQDILPTYILLYNLLYAMTLSR